MVIYYDTSYKEQNIDAEVIEPIVGDAPDTERVKIRVLEGIKEMACVAHKGSYQTLGNAYSALSNWIEENNYQIAVPNRELYIKGGWMTDDPNEYITEIQFPVIKRG